MIKLISVDDRLLHGQIAFFWAEYLNLDKIIVINNEAANDEFTKVILGYAKPKGVHLSIIEMDNAPEMIASEEKAEGSTLIIVGNLFDANQLVHRFNEFKRINICGLRERPNCKVLNERTALSSEDISIMTKLIDEGIDITARPSPQDKEMVLTTKVLNNLL